MHGLANDSYRLVSWDGNFFHRVLLDDLKCDDWLILGR